MSALARSVTGIAPSLADPLADGHLREQGYAVVPVVDAAVARVLRERFLELRPQPGVGFDADLNNGDHTYRAAVETVLSEHLDAAVRGLFADGVPFLWNYLCKWPRDPEDLYLHRDWNFIDERDGARSHSVWIALQDVDATNGMLRVLPRSHLLNGSLAGTGLDPDWLVHTDVIEARLVDVPVPVGWGVVIDHALVHGSYRNRGAAPRVAVGCGVRPSRHSLVHFRRADDVAAERFDVDESFFVDHTPEQLMAARPALPVAERVPVGSSVMTADALASHLDGAVPVRTPAPEPARSMAARSIAARLGRAAVSAIRSASGRA